MLILLCSSGVAPVMEDTTEVIFSGYFSRDHFLNTRLFQPNERKEGGKEERKEGGKEGRRKGGAAQPQIS